jgi:hypothetical protein
MDLNTLDPVKRAALKELARRELARRQTQQVPALNRALAYDTAKAQEQPLVEGARQVGGGLMEGIGSMMPNPITPIKGLISSLTGDTEGEQAALEQERGEWSGGGVLKPMVPEAKEGYETPRLIGNFIGSNIVTPGGSVGTGLKTGLKAGTSALAREAATGVTGALGMEAGQDIAENLAPDSPLAQAIAGLLGATVGGSAPALAGAGKAAATKKFFGDATEGGPDVVTGSDVYDAASRLGIQDDIAPAAYGNDRLKTMTQWVAMNPVGGGRAENAIRMSPEVLGGRVSETASAIRGGAASDVENLPRNVHQLATDAATGSERRAANQMQSAEELIRGDTVADVTPADLAFQRIYKGDPADPASGPIGADYRPGVEGRQSKLQADRTQIIDPQLHLNLLKEKARINVQLEAAQKALAKRQKAKNPVAVQEAEMVIAQLADELDANTSAIQNNMGAAVSQVKEWTGVNQQQANALNIAGNPGIGARYSGKLADTGRDILEGAAYAQGDDIGALYTDARRQWNEAMNLDEGYVQRVRQGLASGEDQGALNWLTKQNLNAKENFEALQTAVVKAAEDARSPEARQAILQSWAQVRGDIIEGLGAKSAGQVQTGPQWSAEGFLTKFQKLKSPEVKAILTGGDYQKLGDLEDASTVAKGLRSLGREQNVSRTQKHALWSSIPTGAAGLLGGLAHMGVSPGAILTGLAAAGVPPALIKMADRFVTNPQTSRDLVRGGRGRAKDIVRRASKSAAVGAANAMTGGAR